AWAIGQSISVILKAIRAGRLSAVQGPARTHSPIDFEWRINPDNVFKLWPKVIDVIPSVRPVTFELIKFCMLNGCRPSEACFMRKSEYEPQQGLWILPPERTKEGDEIEQDLAIPLSRPSIAIVELMLERQQRYRIKSEYVFAHYPARFQKRLRYGLPPCRTTMLNNLRPVLPPEDIKATMHGMRVAMRSWG